MSKSSPKLLDQVRAVLRTKHYSIRTEEAYVNWITKCSVRDQPSKVNYAFSLAIQGSP